MSQLLQTLKSFHYSLLAFISGAFLPFFFNYISCEEIEFLHQDSIFLKPFCSNMVSEDSSSQSNHNNNILHEFVTSSSFNENQFGSHHFDAASYSASLPLSIHCLSERMSRSIDIVQEDRHLIDLLGKSNEPSQQSQRLSLSLGSHPCGQSLNSSILNHGYLTALKEGCEMGLINDYTCDGSGYLNQSCLSQFTNQAFAAGIGNSKYLQPAQSLLQEMLSVGGENIDGSNKKYIEKLSRKGSFRLSSKLKAELSSCELVCEKHGDYVNLLKIIALLEEVSFLCLIFLHLHFMILEF